MKRLSGALLAICLFYPPSAYTLGQFFPKNDSAICPKKDDPDVVASCLLKHFPVGSSFQKLKSYLENNGYQYFTDDPPGIFRFRWRSGDYAMMIHGSYNESNEITSLKASY